MPVVALANHTAAGTPAHCISHKQGACTYELQSLLLLGLARAWFSMAGLIYILLVAIRASASDRTAVTALA